MSGLKGTFFDSFTPATVKTDEELETAKLAKDADADDIDAETGTAAKSMKYADEDEEPELTDEDLDRDEDPEEEPTPKAQDTEPEDLDDEAMSGLVTALAEEEILVLNPDKTYAKGTDGFVEALEDTIEKRKQEWINEIPEEGRSLIDHLKAGRPLEDWVAIKNPENLADADLDDTGTQKALIHRHLTAQGYDEEDIEAKLTKLEDMDELQAEAKVAQKYLIKKQKQEELAYEKQLAADIRAREEAEEDAKEQLKDSIMKTKEIGGFRLDKKRQEELFDHITKPVGKTGKTKLQLNQSTFEKQLLAAYLDMIDYKFEDLEKKAVTKVSGGLRKALSNVATDVNAKRSGGKTVSAPKERISIPRGVWDSRREIED